MDHPHPSLPGDLVRLHLPRDPINCRVPVWRRPGTSSDLVEPGTLAILVGRLEARPGNATTGVCEIMLPGGEIVLCYDSNFEPVPPSP
jgi:hypothetical protein